MRKITTILLLLLFWKIGFGQNPTIQTIPETQVRPLPSVASLMNFAEIPVNEFTGVPNINIPLFNSSTYSKDINYNLSLNYHSLGISFNDKSSDVGTGWNLDAGGSISRIVNVSPDEYQGPHYDDVYNYNFMGFVGSFRINLNSNPASVIHQKNKSNLKIIANKELNGNRIESFVVYDAKGYKYVFSTYDVNVALFPEFITNMNLLNGRNHILQDYRSSFHLKEIFDNNNKSLINFYYQNYTKLEPNTIGHELYFQIKKLTEVNINGFARVTINYDHFLYMENLNSEYSCDSYGLKDILIKDLNNNLIKKIVPNLDYRTFKVKKLETIYFTNNEYNYHRRYLYDIKEFNAGNEEINSIKFAYNLNYDEANKNLFLDSYGFVDLINKCEIKRAIVGSDPTFENALSNKESSSIGILKNIIYKSGGGYEFEYETNTFSRRLYDGLFNIGGISNSVFSNYNDDNKQYDLLYTLNYNTLNQNTLYFNISNVANMSKIYFKFENQPLNIPPQLFPPNNLEFEEVNYTLEHNGQANPADYNFLLHNFSDNYNNDNLYLSESCIGKAIYLALGSYKINLSTYQNLPANGVVKIYQEKYLPNLKKYLYGAGNRIKKITSYEKIAAIDGELTIKENKVITTNYDYNLFDDPLTSSGEFSYGGIPSAGLNADNSGFSQYQINYKNIKKTINNGSLGYVKSTYMLPSSLSCFQFQYRSVTYCSFDGYYDLKDGLLVQQEKYDANNSLKTIDKYQYDFHNNFNNNINLIDIIGLMSGPMLIESWAQLSSKTTNNYFYPNGATTPNIVTTKETFSYNSLNKQIASHTVSDTLGEISTTNYFYHTGNSPTSQNRISEIERIETKKGTELLSESKINYSAAFGGNQSFLPSTIEVKKGQFPAEVRLKNNLYDEFGHVLEVEQDSGVKICYIYGYNKTQPIAKIENATYSSIESQATNLQTISNSGTEENLITALNNLRTSLPNAMVTTYTHKPLIGVSTITDPKGDKITYSYDSFGRLQSVKDKDGNVLSENQYNYRPN